MQGGAVRNLTAVIRDAVPADKAKIYRELGLTLTYQPAQQKALVEMDLNQHSQCSPKGSPAAVGPGVGVRGGSWTVDLLVAPLRTELALATA